MFGSPGGESNILQGDYGEQWLEIVAAAHGLNHGRVASTDLDRADVQLTFRGEASGWQSPSVKVQVKTVADPRRNSDGDLMFDLDVATHNFLCKTNHATGRVLVVIGLSPDDERVRLVEEGTLLIGVAAWVSLWGQAETANEATQVVRVPIENTVDGPGLLRMVTTHGVPRTTPVPEVDVWSEEES